jgi:hypothetical protein
MLSIIITIILCFIALGWVYLNRSDDKLRQYRDVLGLEKANLVYANDYQKVRNLILPTRQTAFDKTEPVIWLYKKDNTELFLGANRNSDVRIWQELKTVLEDVHIVLDSTLNNSKQSNLDKDKLPEQEVELEGNFSKYFKLYCNDGQQVIALQIVAPDIMAYILDNLLSADIEIIDNQVSIIVRDGAQTIERLKASIQLAQQIEKLAKAVTKVTKL